LKKLKDKQKGEICDKNNMKKGIRLTVDCN